MDSRKFYQVKRNMLIDIAGHIASIKELISDLSDHEAEHAADPEMGDFYGFSVILDEASKDVDDLIDSLGPMIVKG
jgi:hypothetical protein